MRSFFALVLAAVAGGVVLAGGGGTAQVNGPHICCGSCVNAVKKILGKVDGVSEVQPDIKSKSVSFKARDAAAAQAGFKALIDGGFYGAGTLDGKELKADVAAAPTGAKSAQVVVKDVHVCCQQCQKAINKLFDGSTVTYEGSGAQRTVKIAGNDLDSGAVLQSLRKAGFNGTLQK
jgi:copper chaperone CopZ